MKATQDTVEHWLPVVGFECYYEVSDLGRVRSCRRKGSRGGLLKTPLSEGYPSVGLYGGGVNRRERVHVMVAAAFLGPRPDGMHVCHQNGDRTDNRAANLRYDSQAENNRDIVRHGRHWESIKTECAQGHQFTPENTRTSPDGRRRSCRECDKVWSKRYHHAKRKRSTR